MGKRYATEQERLDAWAVRHNARNEAKAGPLLAPIADNLRDIGLVKPKMTGAQLGEGMEAMFAGLKELEEQHDRLASYLEETVRRLAPTVHAAEKAAHDGLLERCGALCQPAYRADHWWHICRQSLVMIEGSPNPDEILRSRREQREGPRPVMEGLL